VEYQCATTMRQPRCSSGGFYLHGRESLTKDDAWKLANHWVAAWNGHDLNRIMAHYEDAVELTSPVAAQLLGAPGGESDRKGKFAGLLSARFGSVSGA
jgi:hypothetical protein